ncbi:hypothetical protein QBC33DRAFT_383341 [Phialemonium atrogriseum]|uniref:Uncharacterized protein n=1 Tax=Phialemonium atrogriseum TaxID=1093897 RepID=A0AAJ0C4I8_9PEZI|nr:uncharacterized protein QBC33DRAFT_383341 [Phialemonium atrogriseum]KAK1768574.1 hypothetical protein QBC33DRAFT_383341 [Phialemonium atrogriseum]
MTFGIPLFPLLSPDQGLKWNSKVSCGSGVGARDFSTILPTYIPSLSLGDILLISVVLYFGRLMHSGYGGRGKSMSSLISVLFLSFLSFVTTAYDCMAHRPPPGESSSIREGPRPRTPTPGNAASPSHSPHFAPCHFSFLHDTPAFQAHTG